MKHIFKKPSIYLILLICPILLSLDAPDQRYFDIAKNMEIFSSVYAEVNRAYVDEINPNELIKTGLDAMLKSLDPYTNYIAQEDIEDFRFISTGEYGGIGSMVGVRNNKVVILMPYTGYPAQKGGLKIGDEIIEIDGDNVQGKTLDEVSSYLKGQAGTAVNLKIKRTNQKELIKIGLVREKVNVKNVPYYGMLTKDIGYFKLTQFTQNASANIEEAIQSLKADGAKKIVFDLRYNGGGLLDEAIKICNLFIPKNKEVVSTRGKLSKWNATYKAPSKPLDLDIPLVILINERSASASEIVSGVLQDYDRAVLIGNKTYGKGLVQGTMKTAYNSQIKVTVAKYYIPSGRCIQAIDYSQKDKNGNALEVPDSLLKAFKTAKGRRVLDGDGIHPDIRIRNDTASHVLQELIGKNHIFDFATEYYYTHDTLVGPSAFEFTGHYPDFLEWLKKRDFSFELPANQALLDFEALIKEDDKTPEVTQSLTLLKKSLDKAKSNDLMEFKTEITQEIEREIVSRYYLQEGQIEASFDDDKDLQMAIEVLNNPVRYKSILGGN